MRNLYFDCLYNLFLNDPKSIFITADNGCASLDKISRCFPDRFFNVGIAEQLMVGMASGLALEGFNVYCYAISPFITSRCYEFIKLDVCVNKLPIHLIGIGASLTYDNMGASHHSTEDIGIMRILPNMNVYSPINKPTLDLLATYIHWSNEPSYIRLDKVGYDLYDSMDSRDLLNGFYEINKGKDTCFITTGITTKTIFDLDAKDIGLIDIFRPNPINTEKLASLLSRYKNVITLEESSITGGLGGIISDVFCDYHIQVTRLIKMGVKDFLHCSGSREEMWAEIGLDRKSAINVMEGLD